MILCMVLLHQQQAILEAMQMFLILMLLSGMALSTIPFNFEKYKKEARCLILISSDGSVFCKCDACTCRSRRTNQKESFTFHYNYGICHLWLCSFETVSTILNSFDDTTTKSG
mmetsp:Transcript_8498/g.18631  ORF Transcript_8498/g.18631 Transcript_8498/m.18631 type:complete len:113 (-) Transcript_8498:1140-1478(-)